MKKKVIIASLLSIVALCVYLLVTAPTIELGLLRIGGIFIVVGSLVIIGSGIFNGPADDDEDDFFFHPLYRRFWPNSYKL